MKGPSKKCYDDGDCYYVYTDAWHVWGRWLMLGLLVGFLIVMVPISGYLMSLRRMRNGLAPVSGCSWMFSNPYKNAKQPVPDPEQVPRPPRYRAYDPYVQHQRNIMLQSEQERAQRLNGEYSSSEMDTGELADSTMEEKAFKR